MYTRYRKGLTQCDKRHHAIHVRKFCSTPSKEAPSAHYTERSHYDTHASYMGSLRQAVSTRYHKTTDGDKYCKGQPKKPDVNIGVIV